MDFTKSIGVAMQQLEGVYLLVSDLDSRLHIYENMSKYERMKIAVEVLSLIDFREKEIEAVINNINY